MTDRTVFLGEVAVDSGHLMIVDPCYVLKDQAYDQMCDRILALHEDGKDADNHGGTFPASGMAEGVVFESGLGDGWYAVEAEIGDVPGWGERIKKVTITLIEEDDEEGDPRTCRSCGRNFDTDPFGDACEDCQYDDLEPKEGDDA